MNNTPTPREHPIEEWVITDREPHVVHWLRNYRTMTYEWNIVGAVWGDRGSIPYEFDKHLTRTDYNTPEAAKADLSLACFYAARERAGLPRIEPPEVSTIKLGEGKK